MKLAKNSLQEKSEIYYEQAAIYDRLSEAEDAANKAFDWLLPHIKGKNLLDLGCGTGKYCELFAPYAQHIKGVDAAEAQLEIAKRKTQNFDNVKLVHGDAAHLDLKDKQYDVVIACWMLGTILDIDKRQNVLKRIENTIAPNGSFFLIENNSSGEFEDIRDKTKASKTYNTWLTDSCGFKPAMTAATFFAFDSTEEAQNIIGSIWGDKVAKRVRKPTINHDIIIFHKSF